MSKIQTSTPQVVSPVAAPVVSVINHDQLVKLLMDRAIQISGRGDLMVVTYNTDMLGKGKLRASARTAFDKGIHHVVKTTIQVNYDYATKLENRTGGEETAKGTGTWQHAIEINGHLTPLTVHKADVATEKPLTLIPGARAYLRYEPLTDVQRDNGFGKGDFSRYEDDNGTEIPFETVKAFFFEREQSPVSHRTLSLQNVTEIRVAGADYQIR